MRPVYYGRSKLEKRSRDLHGWTNRIRNHRPPFLSIFHSLNMPSMLLLIIAGGKQRTMSPSRSSTSDCPFSPTAFSAYSAVIRNIAKTARETGDCWPPCGEFRARADSNGPEAFDADDADEDCEYCEARCSPRTSRSRISKMLSGSDICVLRKRCRSPCCPTFELTTQPSSIVQMVGACRAYVRPADIV